MRRKGKGDIEDELARSDIRTHYDFFLSFIDPKTSSLVKSTSLEQQRDIPVYLLGLSQDLYLVIRKVLEVCWVGLWSHPKVKWPAKIGPFSEITNLLKSHELAVAENADGDHIPANLGWYPRDADADFIDAPKKSENVS